MNPTFYSLLETDIPENGMQVSEQIAKESFTSDDQTETVYPFYFNEDGTVVAGVWECAPCRQEIPGYPVNEMMSIIDGALTLTDSDGNARDYGPGDSLFVAKGAKFTWHITKTLRKYFMTAA